MINLVFSLLQFLGEKMRKRRRTRTGKQVERNTAVIFIFIVLNAVSALCFDVDVVNQVFLCDP